MARGGKIATCTITDETEIMGVNTPEDLIAVEKILKSRV